MENEIWKDICFIENNIEYDYTELYKISNNGEIKTLRRNKLLKKKIDKDGYFEVALTDKNGKLKSFRVHRLVAHMFCNGYIDGYVVNHIDENKQNNNYKNLEWCTVKYNNNYGDRLNKVSKKLKGREKTEEERKKLSISMTGKKHSKESIQKMSENNKGGKNPRAIKIVAVNNKTNEVVLLDYIKQCKEIDCKMNPMCVKRCLDKIQKEHRGWKFYYLDEWNDKNVLCENN